MTDIKDNNTEEDIDVEDIDKPWSDYFRYDQAYPDQFTGIETFLDILKDNGFYALEGPCGTGKTLIAVTAVLEAIRNDDYPEYSRGGVFTPNKQQLNQFVDEMRGVNRSLPGHTKPAPTVVMKGKKDMMPYAFCDIPPFDEGSVTTQSDPLRRQAREIIKFRSDIPLDWPDGMNPPESAKYDYDWKNPSSEAADRQDKYKYDPIRAEGVRRILINKQRHDDDYEQLSVDGVDTPYPDIVPHTSHIVSDTELKRNNKAQINANLQGRFDPFYISFFTKDQPSFGFEDAKNNVFDRDTLFELAASEGVCPHECMAHFGQKATFLLGNYNHVFDPETRNLTDEKMGVLDEEMIVVIDEAHRIEDKIRDMMSKTLDVYTIDKAIADLGVAHAYANKRFSDTPLDNPDADLVEDLSGIIDEVFNAVDPDDIKDAQELLEFIKQKIHEMSADYLSEEYGSWENYAESENVGDEEIALSSPDFPSADDKLVRNISKRFNDVDNRMKDMKAIFERIDELFEELEDKGVAEREVQKENVGEFCHDWIVNDSIEFHRQIKLDHNPKDKIPSEYPRWVRTWTPKIQLFNCIPTERLRMVFAQLGGGILMSATLSPPEMFKKVSGMDEIPEEIEETEDGDIVEVGDHRRSEADQFNLRFPQENRESIVVDLPKFTSSNRGGQARNPENMTKIRKRYAESILDVVGSKGNILICMPKYSEAKWAYEYLETKTDKKLYLDQSSTNKETNEMLDEFFSHEEYGAVITSTRGTITEGVDYDGSKLHTCAVVGIPLIDTRPDRIDAIKHAYARKVPEKRGFNTAIKIPAVRKSRQAIGRVIRGKDEYGVRVLIDGRYGSTDWDGAKQYLSEGEQSEFETVNETQLDDKLQNFWNDKQIDAKNTKPNNNGNNNEPTTNSSNETDSQQENTSNKSETVEKIYFGEGADLSGWIPFTLEDIENKIIPIIEERMIKDEGTNGNKVVKINSTKGVDLNGWVNVEKEVVKNELDPVAKDHRKDN